MDWRSRFRQQRAESAYQTPARRRQQGKAGICSKLLEQSSRARFRNLCCSQQKLAPNRCAQGRCDIEEEKHASFDKDTRAAQRIAGCQVKQPGHSGAEEPEHSDPHRGQWTIHTLKDVEGEVGTQYIIRIWRVVRQWVER